MGVGSPVLVLGILFCTVQLCWGGGEVGGAQGIGGHTQGWEVLSTEGEAVMWSTVSAMKGWGLYWA